MKKLAAFVVMLQSCLLCLADVSSPIPVLTVCGDSGRYDRLPFSLTRDTSHRPFRVLIADDIPNGSREGIRGNVWLAAMTAAIIKNDPLDGVRMTVEFSGAIDGPSAGGVTCLAVLQALEGKSLPEDFAMTGTIMPDGTIGIVGGVALKIKAAIKAGVKRICIPAFVRFEKQKDGSYVDLFRMGDGRGVTIFPVRTIEDAYRVINGTDLVTDPISSDVEALSLPADVEEKVIKACTDYFGLRGCSFDANEYQYWNDVGQATECELWNYDNNIKLRYWSLFQRGKVLSANEIMLGYRSIFGDCSCWEITDIATYWDMITKEIAVTQGVTVGNNCWPIIAPPPYNRVQRNQLICWYEEWREHIARFHKEIQKALVDVGRGCFPDEECTEIASQGEDGAQRLADAYGIINQYYASLINNNAVAKLPDDELRDQVIRLVSVCFVVESVWCNINPKAYDENRTLLYAGLPTVKQSSRTLTGEHMFYSASLAIWKILNLNFSEMADANQVAKSSVIAELNSKDMQYAKLMASITRMEMEHQLLSQRKKLIDYNYHLSSQLYRQSQILAQACALHVKYSPDVQYGDREFIYFLARTARVSAIRSIGACKRANIPCIDPVLRLETGDEMLNVKDGDIIEGVLENYWRAYLGAKALIMGFETDNKKDAEDSNS